MKKVLFGLAILMAMGTTVSASDASYCYKDCYDSCREASDAGICNRVCKGQCK